ncbi:tautomerase family protein [Actinoplanes sp. N902-109]|uniref:tautomerase family protein n=1 Tax=Actinoplanes sp. (strain N902-109) TaxID=649831 RepID=UPI0003295F41|nr:tautomerase family protein [Actinoplanes sp. N902-109]AGL16529.1 4-oxalocrotonate tautomerase family protein [Actinoplanes sp. N902-109]
MPIISVTTWDGQDDVLARELMQELTRTVRRVTGAPLDKITVYIQEVPRSRWSEGGALGSDPKFGELSRRLCE